MLSLFSAERLSQKIKMFLQLEGLAQGLTDKDWRCLCEESAVACAALTSGCSTGLFFLALPSLTDLFEATAAEERASLVEESRIEMHAGEEEMAQRSLMQDKLLESRD